jgi:hypothetical protein
MEEISLAALPVGADEDAGDGSQGSDTDGSFSSDFSDLFTSTGTRGADLNKIREVVESQRALLASGNPETLASMTRLVSAYWNQGRLDEAHKLELQVLAAWTGVKIEVVKTASMGDETQRVFYIDFWRALEELESAVSKDAESILRARLLDVLRSCDPLTVKLALLHLPPGYIVDDAELITAVVSNENYGGSVVADFLSMTSSRVMMTAKIKRCICQNEKSGREVWDVILARQPDVAMAYPDFDALMLEARAGTVAAGDGAQLTASSFAKTQDPPTADARDLARSTDIWFTEPSQGTPWTPHLRPMKPMQRILSSSSIPSAVSAPPRLQSLRARRQQQVLNQARSKLGPRPQPSPQDEPKLKLPLTKQPTPSRGRREKSSRVYCNMCDEHPSGFRGAYELQRHISSKHSVTITKFICRDPVSVGIDTIRPAAPLEGCRICQSKKTYGAVYNAAAHLRRAHFNPKTPRKKGDREKRWHMGGGWPTMDTLKLWIEEVLVKQDEPHVYIEGDSEAAPFQGNSQSMPPNSVESTPETPGKELLEHSGMQSSSAASSSQVYEEIHVPQVAISLIMGESGEAIKLLQHTTGCKVKAIQIPDALPGNTMREIGLIGSHDNIMLAKQAIEENVREVVKRPSFLSGARYFVKALY